MDWATFGAFFDKYGYPTIILLLIGVFFYRKVWPLIEKLIGGLIDNMNQQTQLLSEMVQWQAGHDEQTRQHIADTEKIAEMIREGRK